MGGEGHTGSSTLDVAAGANAGRVKGGDVPPEIADDAIGISSRNPDAAVYFITKFCLTMDEDAGNIIRPIPKEKAFVRKIIRTLDFRAPYRNERGEVHIRTLPPANIHGKKSRRMLFTWLVCAYNVFKLQTDPNYTARLMSKSQDSVDDGGMNSTLDSMFGRMRFIWERLPDHVRRPMSWSYMRGQVLNSNAYVTGGPPTVTGGRGTGPSRIFADEFAFFEFADAIHEAIDPACKRGKVYFSSVNGPDNLFARLDEEKPDGWRFIDIGWEDDPDKAIGIRPTVLGPERERYGDKVSPWLIDATSSLTDESIHQEYGRQYQKSTTGMIMREFDRDRHVTRDAIPYDPSLPLHVGLDLGHTRRSVAVIGQPVGMRQMKIIGEYVGEHRNSKDNAQGLLDKLRELGFDGDPEDVYLSPDPNADTEELASGTSPLSRYRAIGFTNILWPLITGPDSVQLGNDVVRVMFQSDMITISGPTCPTLVKSIPAYKLPVDRATNQVKSNKPVHNMASHANDGHRYLETGIWTAEDVEMVGIIPDGPRSGSRPYDVGNRDVPHPHELVEQGDDFDVFQSITGGSHRRVF